MSCTSIRRWAWSLALPAWLVSCTSTTRLSEINARYQDVIQEREGDYHIKPGDSLKVELSTLEQRNLDQAEVKVRTDGHGDLFFMPDHLLAGKTVGEVRKELEEVVRAQVRDAAVSIQVTSSGEKVYLVGQFERPGTIDLLPRMTLAEAISAVGGLRITGDSDAALLCRPYRDPGRPECFRIDLGEDGSQLFLLPGDRITLGRTWVATFVHYLQEYVLFIFDFRIVYGIDSP